MASSNSPNCSHYLRLLISENISVLSVPFVCVRYSVEFEVFLIIVFTVLFIGTAGGNFLVIISVALVKKLQTPSNFLILNLACSDFLVSILVLPGAIYQQINRNRWPFSEIICDIFISFDVILCTSSILNLCAISIDRYLVITRPLQYAVKRTPARIGTMIAISWASSALISIPPMIGWKETFIPGQCNYSENLIYQIYATFGAFYIPLLVMLVLYGRIFKLAREMAQADGKLSLTYSPKSLNEKTLTDVNVRLINGQMEMSFEIRSMNSISKDSSNQLDHGNIGNHRSRTKSHTESKAITTLGVIMGCFLICWLPFFILQIAKSVLKVAKIDYMLYLPLWLIELCLWLGYVNSFLNPIIYVKFNREFRTPFKQILMFKCSSINARLRSETFVKEYGLSTASTKISYCGKRLSVDQSYVAPSVQPGNRRRRQNVAPRLNRINSNPKMAIISNHNPQNYYDQNKTPSLISEDTNIKIFGDDLYPFETLNHHIHNDPKSRCSIYDQRSEKCIYDVGPSSETESINSPPPIDVSINDLTSL